LQPETKTREAKKRKRGAKRVEEKGLSEGVTTLTIRFRGERKEEEKIYGSILKFFESLEAIALK
jgi:hypothetical protein